MSEGVPPVFAKHDLPPGIGCWQMVPAHARRHRLAEEEGRRGRSTKTPVEGQSYSGDFPNRCAPGKSAKPAFRELTSTEQARAQKKLRTAGFPARKGDAARTSGKERDDLAEEEHHRIHRPMTTQSKTSQEKRGRPQLAITKHTARIKTQLWQSNIKQQGTGKATGGQAARSKQRQKPR